MLGGRDLAVNLYYGNIDIDGIFLNINMLGGRDLAVNLYYGNIDIDGIFLNRNMLGVEEKSIGQLTKEKY